MSAAQATLTLGHSPRPAPGASPVRAVVFDGCLGQLHLADGATGVLMCSPWGYEELCARRSWRLLAEAVAAAGAPCLRFDYPGAGDSLDRPPGEDDFEAWIAAAVTAAEVLRQAAGVQRLILLGQGLGAAVASLAARRIEDVCGLVLMAPVTAGRAHLRELAMWGSVVSASIRLPAAAAGEAIGVAGFVLPQELSDSVKRIDLIADPPPAVSEALVVARPGHGRDAALADLLERRGAQVRRRDYDGYEALLTDPTTARTPRTMIEAVTGWVADRLEPPGRPQRLAQGVADRVELTGSHFVETPVRFGAGANLFGVLCRPLGARRGRSVLMLNSGYDPHTGWARTWVEQARSLAAQGVASFRIDASGVGDSPVRPGAPEQVLYGDDQVCDVVQAIDWLEAQGLGPVVLAGRCSGAYLGLDAGVADRRVAGLVLVNPLRLVWRPGESVDEAIRSASLNHYRARALQPETLGRILRGEVDLGRLTLQVFRRELSRLAAGGRVQSALRAKVHAKFADLRARDIPISLVYSEGDDGLIELAAYFGREGRELAAYPNLRRSIIPGADHNLTPPAARARLFEALKAAALG